MILKTTLSQRAAR